MVGDIAVNVLEAAKTGSEEERKSMAICGFKIVEMLQERADLTNAG